MRRFTDDDRRRAIRRVLSAFAREDDLAAVLRDLAALEPCDDIFLAEVLLELAADAIEEAHATRQDPVDYHEIRERYLPEVEFRGRSDHFKSHYALRAAPMIAAGVTPDLADDASWWRAENLWVYSTYALLAYLRIASARTGDSTADICRRIAQRRAVDLTQTSV